MRDQSLIVFLFLTLVEPEIVHTKRMELNGRINKKGKRIKYAYLNSTVELICETIGLPLPDIVWHHTGKKISQSFIRTFNGTSVLSVSSNARGDFFN